MRLGSGDKSPEVWLRSPTSAAGKKHRVEGGILSNFFNVFSQMPIWLIPTEAERVPSGLPPPLAAAPHAGRH